MTTRNQTLDIARGSAVIMVVFMHVTLGTKTPDIISAINFALAGIRMPVLLLISGFLTARLMHRDNAMSDRVAHFAWLFAVWTLVSMIIFMVTDGVPFTDFAASYATQFILPTSPLWFLWCVAILTLVAKWTEKSGNLIIVIAAFAAMIADATTIDSFVYDHVLKYSVFFFIGIHYGHPIIDLTTRHPRRAMMISLAVTALGLTVDHFAGWRLCGVPERLSMAVLMILGCMAIAKTHRPALILSWFGRHTLPIFAAHAIFIHFVYLAIGHDLSILEIVGTTGFAIAASLALEVFLKRVGATWMFSLPRFKSRRMTLA